MGSENEDHFWDLAEEMIATSRAKEGTIMGHRCIRRADGEFLAMFSRTEDACVVKLTPARVSELIQDEAAAPFAPAGKVFKAWAAVTAPGSFQKLLEEAAEA